MNYKKEIGKRIRAERDALKWSLETLAQKTAGARSGPLSKSRISNYEQGLRLPGPREIKVLAQTLQADAAYLMCLDTGEDEMNKEEMDLLRNYRRLPENERLAYSRRIDSLAQLYRDPLPDEKLPAGLKQLPATAPPDPNRRRRFRTPSR